MNVRRQRAIGEDGGEHNRKPVRLPAGTLRARKSRRRMRRWLREGRR